MSIDAALVILAGVVFANAAALYNHVRECREIREKLGRIMEHLEIK